MWNPPWARSKALAGLEDRGFRVEVSKFFEPEAETTDYSLRVMDPAGKLVGKIDSYAAACAAGGWASVSSAIITKPYRGRGIYPEMLVALRDVVQKDGCKGIFSGSGNRSADATKSWQKFAAREPRVSAPADRPGYFFLSGRTKRRS